MDGWIGRTDRIVGHRFLETGNRPSELVLLLSFLFLTLFYFSSRGLFLGLAVCFVLFCLFVDHPFGHLETDRQTNRQTLSLRPTFHFSFYYIFLSYVRYAPSPCISCRDDHDVTHVMVMTGMRGRQTPHSTSTDFFDFFGLFFFPSGVRGIFLGEVLFNSYFHFFEVVLDGELGDGSEEGEEDV